MRMKWNICVSLATIENRIHKFIFTSFVCLFFLSIYFMSHRKFIAFHFELNDMNAFVSNVCRRVFFTTKTMFSIHVSLSHIRVSTLSRAATVFPFTFFSVFALSFHLSSFEHLLLLPFYCRLSLQDIHYVVGWNELSCGRRKPFISLSFSTAFIDEKI